MQNNTLDIDITEITGFHDLSDEDKTLFLEEAGDIVLRSALLKLIQDLTDDQIVALDYFLETEPSADMLMNHLFEHYAGFELMFEEEVIAFKKEALAVLS